MTVSPKPHGGTLPPTPPVGPTYEPGDPVWTWYADSWLRGTVHARGGTDRLDEMWPGVYVRDGLLIKLAPGHAFRNMPADRSWDLLIPDASSPYVRPGDTVKPRPLQAVTA